MEITKKHRQILLKKLKTQRGEFCEECGSIKDLVVYFKDKDEDNFKNNNTFLLCEVCKKDKLIDGKDDKDAENGDMREIGYVASGVNDQDIKGEIIGKGELGGTIFKQNGRAYFKTKD